MPRKPRYQIGLHQKRKKEQREKMVAQNESVEEMTKALNELEREIEIKRNKLEAKQAQLRRLDLKVSSIRYLKQLILSRITLTNVSIRDTD